MQFKTFSEMIRRQAEDLRDQTAFVTPSRTWTYAEVDAESSRTAQGLAALGIGCGDRVACLTKHIPECIVLLLAASKLGAVCAPLNWRLAATELEYVINQSEAKVLLTDQFLLPTLLQVSMPDIRRLLIVDAERHPDALAPWRASYLPGDPGYVGEPDDTILQLCSSGTTGLPKAVELTHSGIMLQCQYSRSAYCVDATTVQLNVLPTFHVAGTVSALSMLLEGAVSVSLPEFEPARVIRAIAEHRITQAFLVPAMILFLLQVPGVAAADFSSLNSIAYGGSPVSEQLLVEALRVFNCDMMQVYGFTEASGALTALSATDHYPSAARVDLLRSAGRPIEGVSLKIVDPGSGRSLADGEVGEIWARTRQLLKGYFRDEQATAQSFPEGRDEHGGWFRTGDAGYLRDGYLYINDRVKDMVISGGENIYPSEVENAIAAHPAVADVAVIGVPDQVWGEAVKACVVLRQGAQVTETELIDFTRERLARYKCPKSVDFVDVLPRNPSGKLLKRILREPYWSQRDRQVG